MTNNRNTPDDRPPFNVRNTAIVLAAIAGVWGVSKVPDLLRSDDGVSIEASVERDIDAIAICIENAEEKINAAGERIGERLSEDSVRQRVGAAVDRAVERIENRVEAQTGRLETRDAVPAGAEAELDRAMEDVDAALAKIN